MKIKFCTLGCKVNQYDSGEMLCRLKEKGYDAASANEEADIYIINSCTVTEESSRKSKQAVRRLRAEHPDAVIILTGCYTQAFAKEAENLSYADIIIGNNTNSELPEILDKYFNDKKQKIDISEHTKDEQYRGDILTDFEGHTRAFIKIQDGCNRYCTYCIIPKSRGFSRSKAPELIKKELELLAAQGYKEVVFVGINLSSYGKDIGLNICDALELAQETDGIERIRLGSLEPDHITDEVIARLVKMTKFCPQFHLSLQSGCDAILKRMNRHYTSGEYTALCEKLRQNFRNVSLTTDIIVGFPGETEDNFNDTMKYAEEMRFMKVHIFPFSPRTGTPAAEYSNKISKQLKSERCARLSAICEKTRADFLNAVIGKTVDVLFETPKNGYQHGYTKNYIPVAVKTNENITGKILPVKITGVKDDICIAELI